MTKLKNRSVLITGGASGIGKIMARRALEKGANVMIWDVNAQGIADTVNKLAHLGKITGKQVNIADYEAVVNAVKETDGVDILINNAGIVVGEYFDLHTKDQIDASININVLGTMYVTHSVMPQMVERGSGHICNVSSMAGMISDPKLSVYCASKWAVLGWSDSIRLEMRERKTGVKVTSITPYFIDTGMFDGVHSLLPLLKPEKTARHILKAIEHNRIYLGIPFAYHFSRLVQGFLPVRWFDVIVGKWMGIYGAMDTFKGRK